MEEMVEEKVHPFVIFNIELLREYVYNLLYMYMFGNLYITYLLVSVQTKEKVSIAQIVLVFVIQLSPDIPGFPPIYLYIDIHFKI